jgi:oligopeptide transport system substrate-binding protein
VARLSRSRPSRLRAGAILGSIAVVAAVLLAGGWRPAGAANRDEVRILSGPPATYDPAAAGDATTAGVTAQLYETLTTYDASLILQPALAAGWDVADDGTRVVFHLRPNLTFSDGAPLTAQDVVGSWLRIIDPAKTAPLAALMLDVKGARDHLAGRQGDPALVGLKANGGDVEVELERPGADFPAIVSSPLFGVVPPGVWSLGRDDFGPGSVVSGGYQLASADASAVVLRRNERYWAGPPAIATVRLVLDIGGRSEVAAFEAGDLDFTPIDAADAPWIPYDPTLGPQLRRAPSLNLTYLGLDAARAPFNDVRVRQAVGAAVDWRRIAELGAFGGLVPARSMVPPGITGAGDADWLPVHDPGQARRLLADAGFANGSGLPRIELGGGEAPIAGAIAADLERELGMHVDVVIIDDLLRRIDQDPPAMWLTGWIADYPGPNDFLGVLLESDSSENAGHWSSPPFDKAIGDALATRDPAASEAAFERALAEVQRDVPAVPLYVGTDWALSRGGLLGAGDNGMGILRMAGMAWAP